jgi:serine/threonine protein phosphatase PrpC
MNSQLIINDSITAKIEYQSSINPDDNNQGRYIVNNNIYNFNNFSENFDSTNPLESKCFSDKNKKSSSSDEDICCDKEKLSNVFESLSKKIESIKTPIETVLMEPFVITRITDECVHQLGSAQDVVYKTKNIIDENVTEWTMALFDGHGSVKGFNPYTKLYEKFNLTLLVLNEMIHTNVEGTEKTILDTILEKDIFSDEDNPAIAMQRAMSKVCMDKKCDMRIVGSTMVLVKVRHNTLEKKINVEILSIGDSRAVIYHNDEKVLETPFHSAFNDEEIERLKKEKRISIFEPTISTGNIELLDEKTICSKKGIYANFKGLFLASTQSIGHIHYSYGKVLDESGITGLAPFKTRMEFSDTDNINIKLFSDGVSDIIDENIIVEDHDFMLKSNANETANFAKERWGQKWRVCKKEDWPKYVNDGDESIFNKMQIDFIEKKNADDVSCISWIQKRNP